MDRPKFLVDRMLGRLVAWLRIFDYDTKSALELTLDGDEDAGLIPACPGGRQSAVDPGPGAGGTCDKSLRARCPYTAGRCKGAALRAHAAITRWRQSRSWNAAPPATTPAEATEADMDRIRKEVPAHLIEEGKEFWICDHCGRIYWLGSHWRNIQKMADELKSCRLMSDRSRLPRVTATRV